ncbi:ROK family protein [Prevotella sp. A2931]|uniref:ROK family protein n=1 Tax=Prevotella illustrans TaxID=2800387 RepID=A0ABS3M6I0_9BACT|nr:MULTISPECIES: ROK family protein [Prevotella]MBO1363745.1 ROK family protein [Prevotella illustrans]PTL26235.1 sugar kinase [Prevotella sp. oral taxon 820]
MATTIAIDLGGTNIRAARINNGIIERKTAADCNANGTKQEIIDQLFVLVGRLINPQVESIGIGVPSVVDHDKGIVYDVQHIPSWDIVPLKELMENRFHIRTEIDNDVNCYVLGEKYFGAGRPYCSLVGITLGTGVGAGILIDNRVCRGVNTGAGEIGCLPYLDANYEQYCSSQWMKRRSIDAETLSRRAATGDAEALKLWAEFGCHLGKLMQAILFTYDPEAIIIGGGIAGGATYFKASMLASMADNFPYAKELEHIQIHFSTLKDSNLLGASLL